MDEATENAPARPRGRVTRGAAHVRFNSVYLRWRGTAADATPPRRSRLGFAGLSARDKPVEGTRDAVAKEDVEGGARAVARRGGHAWRAILECGLCGEGALGS